MRVKGLLAAAGAALLLATAGTSQAQDNITPIPQGALSRAQTAAPGEDSFSEAQQDEIGRIVRDYLIENPDVIVEVLQILQTRQQQAQQEHQRQQNRVDTAAVVDTERDPIVGDLEGTITVVEFFDYHCPFCKRISSSVARLLENEEDVRFVYKEFPVFGEDSVFAARAALASQKQGLYKDYHLALMKNRGRLSERVVMRLADRVGLDVDQLREDMDSPEIEQTIQNNYRIAQELGIRGTPSFIIGDEIIPGALDINTMRRLIQAKRQS